MKHTGALSTVRTWILSSITLGLLLAVLPQAMGQGAANPNIPEEERLKKMVKTALLAFNRSVQEKDFTSFYRIISATWQDQTTPKDLKKAFQAYIDNEISIEAIKDLTPTFDPEPLIDGDGTLIVKGEYPIEPYILEFKVSWMEESKMWRISGLKVNLIIAQMKDMKVPDEAGLEKLTTDAILVFNKSVAAEDFTLFHQYISHIWKGQTTPEDLKSAFQVFIDIEADFSGIEQVRPLFENAPAVDEDAQLAVKGYYPTTPSQVHFDFHFLPEKTEWKLSGFNLNLKPTDENEIEVPDMAGLEKLTTEAVLAFHRGVNAKDFTAFHQYVCRLWREQTTPEELKSAFQTFIDIEADFSAIANVSPVFEGEPTTDGNGQLLLKGYYPTTPSQLHFDFGFLPDPTGWKLSTFNLDISEPEGE